MHSWYCLKHTFGFFYHRCANDYFDVVVLLLLLYRHLYDHMTVDFLQKVTFLILPTTTILILWSKIYDYLYFDLFLLLFCWYTNTYTIIWLAADSCFLDIAYYKHLDSVIKIYELLWRCCYYTDIYKVILLCWFFTDKCPHGHSLDGYCYVGSIQYGHQWNKVNRHTADVR